MTRKEARELLPLIQAYAEGKTIERKNLSGSWTEATCPSWANNIEYRIKPEPKYRPFKNQEECWQEMLKHQPFGWLKNKESGGFALIGSIYKGKEVWFIWVTNGGNAYKAYDLFNDYIFADGTPFGITR